ncbi:MAG: type II toxin-antitoxin system prevent-host-death family antitoxin [Actinomycetota bacterium]
MDVSVRELKAKLSEMLDRAERGELVRVTDRGRPKAVLGPLPGKLRLEEGIAQGWVTPGSGEPLPAVARVKPASQALSSEAALDEDRGR